MPVKHALSKRIRVSLIGILLFTASNCVAQHEITYRAMDSVLRIMHAALDSGHYARIDSMHAGIERWVKSGKPVDQYYFIYQQIDLYDILRKRMMRDGFRKTEADSIGAIMAALEKEKNNNLVNKPNNNYNRKDSSIRHFEIGLEGGIDLPARSGAGYTAGVFIGVPTDPLIRGSLQVGLFRQQSSFSLDVVRNKDGSNNYTSNGYLLNTKGHFTSTNIPVRIAFRVYKPEDPADFGFNIIGGLEWKHIGSVQIDRYYYEHSYRDSLSPSGDHILRFSALDRSDYKDKKFFARQDYFYFHCGFALYYWFANNFVVTLQPLYYANIGKRWRETITDAPFRTNYWSLRFNVSYWLGHKVPQQKPGLYPYK